MEKSCKVICNPETLFCSPFVFSSLIETTLYFDQSFHPTSQNSNFHSHTFTYLVCQWKPNETNTTLKSVHLLQTTRNQRTHARLTRTLTTKLWFEMFVDCCVMMPLAKQKGFLGVACFWYLGCSYNTFVWSLQAVCGLWCAVLQLSVIMLSPPPPWFQQFSALNLCLCTSLAAAA